jgi:hypothetical protein
VILTMVNRHPFIHRGGKLDVWVSGIDTSHMTDQSYQFDRSGLAVWIRGTTRYMTAVRDQSHDSEGGDVRLSKYLVTDATTRHDGEHARLGFFRRGRDVAAVIFTKQSHRNVICGRPSDRAPVRRSR